MERSEFIQRTKEVYSRIFDAFEEIDPDIAEADMSLDNVTITYADRSKIIINRQAATSQIWVATKREGLHFNYDAETNEWRCDKTGRELFQLLVDETKNATKLSISI